MGKYKVGDELIIINSEMEDSEKMMAKCFLDVNENISTLSMAIKIVDVKYDKPEVMLSYRTPLSNTVHKVVAVCKDVEDFDTEKVLEKALLKAHLQEVMKLSTLRNYNLNKFK